ncbi:unnamed protein product [Spodoptera exigua]|nr:unnamed protein product [Spodoptera exigua]
MQKLKKIRGSVVGKFPTRTRPERTARSVPRAPQKANGPPQQTGPYRADVKPGCAMSHRGLGPEQEKERRLLPVSVQYRAQDSSYKEKVEWRFQTYNQNYKSRFLAIAKRVRELSSSPHGPSRHSRRHSKRRGSKDDLRPPERGSEDG